MNRASWTVLAGLAVGALAGALLLSPEPADADRTVVLSTSRARLTHGDFHRPEPDDGGWVFRVCGETTSQDGGTHPVERACVTCEPGAFQDAPATCRNVWRAANGL